MQLAKTTVPFAFIVILAACAQAPKSAPTTNDDSAKETLQRTETLAREFVQRHKLPGLAMGVIEKGKLVWHGGFTHAEGAAPDSNTLLRIGSVTKVITAQTILRLRDIDMLTLEDPVAKFVPEAEGVLSPPGGKAVLVRHLIAHSSGIPTLGDGTLDWTQGPEITEAALVASIAACKLRFEPGSAFEYSNAGMALAGIVVSRVSGQRCREYITAGMLTPLEMKKTVWEAAPSQVWPGHVKQGGNLTRAASYWNLGAIEPAGGLYSTVADMARFVAFQLNPERNPGVLAADSVRQSHKPGAHGCGLGWMIGGDAQLGAIVWHNGSTHAHGAWVGFAPGHGIGVVILLATGELDVVGAADRLGVSAMRIAAGLQPLPEPPPAAPTPTPVVGAVVERLRALLADPAKGDIKGAFTEDFLRAVPEAELRKFFADLSAALGKFERHELIEDHGHGEFMLRLHGARDKARTGVVAKITPPHLMDGLWVEGD